MFVIISSFLRTYRFSVIRTSKLNNLFWTLLHHHNLSYRLSIKLRKTACFNNWFVWAKFEFKIKKNFTEKGVCQLIVFPSEASFSAILPSFKQHTLNQALQISHVSHLTPSPINPIVYLSNCGNYFCSIGPGRLPTALNGAHKSCHPRHIPTSRKRFPTLLELPPAAALN